jgi:DNA-binding protein H-NS
VPGHGHHVHLRTGTGSDHLADEKDTQCGHASVYSYAGQTVRLRRCEQDHRPEKRDHEGNPPWMKRSSSVLWASKFGAKFGSGCSTYLGLGPEIAPIALSAAKVKPVSTDDLDSWERKIEQGASIPRFRKRTGQLLILAEKSRLDQQLRQLVEPGATPANVKKMPHARRPYPQVLPKYRNPAEPSETWAGRGKQPRWLTAQLRSGKQLDDFRIKPPSDRARRRNSRTNRKMPEGGLNRFA